MRIGIIDCDLVENPDLSLYNVEALKIIKYYEKNGHEACVLLPGANVFQYDKLIICGQMTCKIYSIMNIDKHPNKEYIGPAFNNLQYIPIGINEVDFEEVDTKYYDKLVIHQLNKDKTDISAAAQKERWLRLFPTKQSINLKEILTGEIFRLVDNYIFDKENWEEIIKTMSIYPRYFKFVMPQIIKTQEDFDNFLKIKSYGFIVLNCAITIENVDDFRAFCEKNKDNLNAYKECIFYTIGYSSSNNYTEEFFLKELNNVFKKIEILNDLGIDVVRKGFYIRNSNYIFTHSMFLALSDYIKTAWNNNRNFKEAFTRTVRIREVALKRFYSFLNHNQQYYFLFNKKFKRRNL